MCSQHSQRQPGLITCRSWSTRVPTQGYFNIPFTCSEWNEAWPLFYFILMEEILRGGCPPYEKSRPTILELLGTDGMGSFF